MHSVRSSSLANPVNEKNEHAVKPLVSPDFFLELIEHTEIYGIFTLNPDGVVLTWNKGATAVQSYTAKQTVGKPYGKLYEKEVNKPNGYFNEMLNKARDEGFFQEQGWRKRQDGKRFWATLAITPIYDEEKKLLAYTLCSQDITAQKLASELSEITEAADKTSVLATSNIVLNRAPDGQFTAPHLQWEIFTGQSWPEYEGFGWLKMYPKEDHKKIKMFFESLGAMDLGKVRDDWQALQQPDINKHLILNTKLWSVIHKEYRHIIFSVVPKFNANGTIQQWVCNEKDVHKMKLIELELRQTLDKKKLMLSSARLGLWEINFEAETVEIDQNSAHFFAIDLVNFRGTLPEIMAHIHPEDRQLVQELIERCKQTGDSLKSEFRVVWPDGSIHFLVWHGKLDDSPLNQPKFLMGICWDITETRQLLEERARVKAVEKQNHEQAEFVDGVCHELRNPLNGINGYLDELNEVIDGMKKIQTSEQLAQLTMEEFSAQIKQLEKISEVIDDCSTHQRNVINQVIEISKIEASKIILAHSSFMLQAVINSLIALNETTIKAKSLHLTRKMPTEPVWVKGDATRFKQILMNLFANAANYTLPQGALNIELVVHKQHDSHIEFEVLIQDTGPGFTPEQIANLFKKYIPVSSHSFTKYESSGLGLAISKGLTELLGGTLVLESEKDKGSLFRIKFNWAVGEPPAKKVTQVSATLFNSPQATQKKVLIVDDNPINRKILSRIVEKKGYLWAEAADGQEAIDRCISFEPDLIFMDLEMPNKDGLQATTEIRALRPPCHTPIYAVSGYARDEYREKARNVGMQGYIVKPFKNQEIHDILTQHLESQQPIEAEPAEHKLTASL